MAPQDSYQDDRIASAVCSGSAYDRVRYERYSFFRQTVPRTLTAQSGVLALLALTLPMYGLYPESAATYLPATDPAVASPKAVLLAVFGGGMILLSAALLVATGLYRARISPLTEAQAHSVIDAEDFARYVGLGTGGLAVLLSVCLFAVGLGGGDAIGTYVATTGRNPFVDSGTGLSVETLALVAYAASVLLFFVGRYLSVRLLPTTQ
ncbi:hypothetical protein ACFQJ5_02315 [Halomicroarcula sp. GCM10025324]|uniref:hypothetical protein n=1 Tax=Haloarcula TaxID=2237 RepID=UPI0023E89F7F|nr:hypothetical protein [Halomicroarcula sp. ZS-22-S1]